MALPTTVRIVEVGPRDGLQNESSPVSVETRIQLIEALVATGIRHIEGGSFVSPRWVPQMASSDAVFNGLRRVQGVTYSALTPNRQGLEAAMAAEVSEVAVFAAASEGFSQKNINCSIAQSITRFQPVTEAALAAGIPVRGYVSCVVGCPYEGVIKPSAVSTVTEQLLGLGCYEVSLGDTIGVGTPGSFSRLLDELVPRFGVNQLALHCHNTYGQALANILTGLNYGIAVVDSSVAGLGGCPYAQGASGNVATEDVVYMLDGMGIETGVNLSKLVPVAQRIADALGRTPSSSVARAMTTT